MSAECKQLVRKKVSKSIRKSVILNDRDHKIVAI